MQSSIRDIILDSNILQYLTNKEISPVLIPYLFTLKQKQLSFGISAISVYELLKGISPRNELKMKQILNSFKQYGLIETTLEGAAQLETLYKIDGIDPRQIEMGDKLIAATAWLTTAYILTANARDFPSPYFKEDERVPLIFQDKRKRTKCILITLLVPDFTIINQKIKER